MTKIPDAMLIDGQLRKQASAGWLELVEPATQKKWCKVPAAGKAEVEETVNAADKAYRQAHWAKAAPSFRADMLLKLARLVRENCESMAMLESRNVGKPISSSRAEILAGARCFEYYAGAITQFYGKTIPLAEQSLDYTLRAPVGVVACIVPWNFPFLMSCWKVAPALVTGNAVILKPASLTPLSALRMGELAVEAGIPPGIFQVIAGRGSEMGDQLVSHSLVRKISLTGQTSTGAHVLKLAADDIKRVSLELGGKSPNIIFDDAKVIKAARTAPLSVFDNTGQDCCARSRMLVHQPVYDQFLDEFIKATQPLIIGSPLEESTQIGPMVSANQRESVEACINVAREEGGMIHCGADRPIGKGFYLSPTIIDGLDSNAQTCQEEIFGPVACVIPFEDEAHAIELANDTEYGLSASIWTENLGRAHRVAAAIESGVISVNTNSSVYVEAPFGGFKKSGVGRDLGMEAMLQYTELKNIFISLKED
jgi:betaine-aldehyde dehydrogenase